MAAPTFDATRYEQDKVRWRAERDALRDYAEFVRETVGGLGLTVHDVLWHAIEAQSWIDRLPAALRTVILPEAVRLDPHRVHAAKGSLAALEKRFGDTLPQAIVVLSREPRRECSEFCAARVSSKPSPQSRAVDQRPGTDGLDHAGHNVRPYCVASAQHAGHVARRARWRAWASIQAPYPGP